MKYGLFPEDGRFENRIEKSFKDLCILSLSCLDARSINTCFQFAFVRRLHILVQ